jgi:peptide deformylase
MTLDPDRPAMTLPAIVQAGAPTLRERAGDVPRERIATAEFQDLIDRMIAVMRMAPGVGLAAPQIDVPLRVVVLEDTATGAAQLTDIERRERERVPFPLRVFVNPVLRPVADERAMFFEGCLSIPGYVGLVERNLEVEVAGLDRHGRPQSWRVRGWPARILQHEIDHLDGILFVDRMAPRSFMTPDHAKARFAGKAIAEIRRILGV